MNKVLKMIFAGIFFSVCTFFGVGLFFSKNSADIEKKEKTEFPSLISEGEINSDFSTQFEAYVNENLIFRSELIAASNVIKTDLYKTPSSNVLIGKSGWLFFNSTYMDYVDSNHLSDKKLRSIAVTLDLIRERIEENGGSFVFAGGYRISPLSMVNICPPVT